MHRNERFPGYAVSLLSFLFLQDYAKLSKQKLKERKAAPKECKIKKENNFVGGKGSKHFRKDINLYICIPMAYFNLKDPMWQGQSSLVWCSILTTQRQAFNKYLSDRNTQRTISYYDLTFLIAQNHNFSVGTWEIAHLYIHKVHNWFLLAPHSSIVLWKIQCPYFHASIIYFLIENTKSFLFMNTFL